MSNHGMYYITGTRDLYPSVTRKRKGVYLLMLCGLARKHGWPNFGENSIFSLLTREGQQ